MVSEVEIVLNKIISDVCTNNKKVTWIEDSKLSEIRIFYVSSINKKVKKLNNIIKKNIINKNTNNNNVLVRTQSNRFKNFQ